MQATRTTPATRTFPWQTILIHSRSIARDPCSTVYVFANESVEALERISSHYNTTFRKFIYQYSKVFCKQIRFNFIRSSQLAVVEQYIPKTKRRTKTNKKTKENVQMNMYKCWKCLIWMRVTRGRGDTTSGAILINEVLVLWKLHTNEYSFNFILFFLLLRPFGVCRFGDGLVQIALPIAWKCCLAMPCGRACNMCSVR